MATTPNNTDGPPNQVRARFGGLIAILIGIVLGGLLGVLYGRTMWLSSGGPQRLLAELRETLSQKPLLAEAYDAQADAAAAAGRVAGAVRMREEAQRLRAHIPRVQQRIDQVQQLVAQVEIDQQAGLLEWPRLVWELTKFCGELFLQVLFLLVIPLVVTSMVSGITSLGDVRKIGRLGGATIIYYLTTACVAVLIGIALVQMIQPGRGADDTFARVSQTVFEQERKSALETLLAVFVGEPDRPGSGMFPRNIFVAAAETNVLALIVFALVFGGALTTLGSHAQPVIDFFQAANEAVMKMVHLVMWFAPVGIFGLVATSIARQGGGSAFVDQLTRLGWYVMTVLSGLTIHVVFLAAVLALLARRGPIVYTVNMLRALLTAVSTSSSSATLPITLECVTENNGVSNRSAGFVLPLGATINMDGTALYEAVAVIFIAQSLGMELTAAQLVIIFLTATLAAIGAAGIPEAGLVTMVIVLAAVGLPPAGIGTILAIDWFLDRMRTTVNVYGDSVGAAVIDRMVVQQS
jgi:Na+/H+-dicarboxylate symporter